MGNGRVDGIQPIDQLADKPDEISTGGFISRPIFVEPDFIIIGFQVTQKRQRGSLKHGNLQVEMRIKVRILGAG
ncbi:hypothetical protein GCM10028825_09670 [Spirosoma agri]